MSEPKPASITTTATGSGRYILLRDGWVDKWVWVHTDEELAARDKAVRREALAEAEESLGGCICDERPHSSWCHLPTAFPEEAP